MNYYTERHGMRISVEKTFDIDPGKYGILLRCCEQYYDNIAWKYPDECRDGCGCCGIDKWKLATDMRYEIPSLFISESGLVGIPRVMRNVFEHEPTVDKYDQYALLDFIEFMYANVRDVQKGDFHKFYNHYHMITQTTIRTKTFFRENINKCFEKLGLLYTLDSNGEVQRVLINDITSAEIINTVLSVNEKGTKELLQEAISLHRSHDPNAARDAVEKLWDAFERLKTYYTSLNKKDSVDKIISDISSGSKDYYTLFEEEFINLTKIGNEYRIRHHETYKKDITCIRYYDYFFNRCLSLIALAVQYLK